MAEPKTKLTKESVTAFLKRATDEATRADCLALVRLMEEASGEKARMWGTSIVGFGLTHLVYASGREVDWPLIAFSPRKKELTLYGMGGADRHPELMKKLGKHGTGKGCLYIKRLADVDMKVLKALVTASVKHKRKQG
jgi:Domain of unknown function (DU1801)